MALGPLHVHTSRMLRKGSIPFHGICGTITPFMLCFLLLVVLSPTLPYKQVGFRQDALLAMRAQAALISIHRTLAPCTSTA